MTKRYSKLMTRDETVAEIRALQSSGCSMRFNDLPRNLTYAITTHFTTYGNAKKELGVEVNRKAYRTKESPTDAQLTSYENKRKWTEDKIAETLREISDGGRLPSMKEIYRSGLSGLVGAVKSNYGTWLGGIKYFGYDPYEHTQGNTIYTDAGLKFEYVLGDILNELNVDYEKYAHEHWNPDFVLKDNVWVDAKLSYWTEYNEMLTKYLPHCNELIVVYMRGPVLDETVEGGLPHRKMSVYKLLDKLDESTRTYYAEKLEGIESELLSKKKAHVS